MIKNILPNITFIPQPNGYTCGSTSLYNMAINKNIKTPDILTLSDKMGTNSLTGTTDVEMTKGLQFLNIPVKRYAMRKDGTILTKDNCKGKEDALQTLKDGLDRGEVFLWRTLMGMYHWVLVYGYQDDKIMFMCSCSGKRIENADFVYKVWSPRDFDGFRV